VRTIYQRIRLLKNSPDRGRPGRRSGTRELALTPLPYVVVYAVKAEAVEILHIYHGAQDWR
jgi:plasmid stabilization system protein ParE